MKVFETGLKDCFLLEATIFKDNRGYFFESYNKNKFKELTGLDIDFIQDNQASSSKNVVRGLHIQRPPHMQSKLVRAISGVIWDVAVDVRKNSPTYGKWFGAELSETNNRQLFVPQGFLHGYSVLSEHAVVAYKCDDFYNKSAEDNAYLFDKNLAIDWKVSELEAIISEKDIADSPFNIFKAI
ncbi:MAG: dTDP-4-dehydrorhamnose 3,5-epimerase [Solirubrobacteraceae bacterium]